MEKSCNKCGIVKPISDYYVRKKGSKGQNLYHGQCKKCLNAFNLKKYYGATEEQVLKRKENNLRTHLNRKYGLTLENFSAMILKQNNKCKICSFDMKDDPQVDHNHITSNVRGLLCRSCNMSLGLLKENTETLYKMISYINNDNLQKD
jgi:hypothetical protein